jgi:hypothetical protein
MFYFEMLDLIKNNANELTRRLCKELLEREETRGIGRYLQIAV